MRQCMDADNLHRRLKKIIGQVQAIDRMVDEDVPCEDVLSQMFSRGMPVTKMPMKMPMAENSRIPPKMG